MRWALQVALLEFVTTPPLELEGVTIKVFDSVPSGQPKPYITLGEDNLEPDDTDDSHGAEILAEFTIYSEYAGRKEAKRVADLLHERLHEATLTVPGYTLARAFLNSSDNFDEVDGATRRTVETYRVLLQE